ncbi:MAG: hypothetical protein MUD16_15185 [Desulfobacterales bacterium]|jgi:hypothetical protein|nr:hypothetical protein [Desulfobacterales bacterium]
MQTATERELRLRVAAGGLARFLPLLGQGVRVTGASGASAEQFIRRELAIAADYLNERIQTVFLDGKAIDDLGAAEVGDGSTLALSAAMPGLAGAVLRRGGAYAAMRRQISHEGRGAAAGGGTVRVRVKLFNLVARELGPDLLTRGVWVSAADLRGFLDRLGAGLGSICRAAQWQGRPVACRAAAGRLPAEGWVLLRITED